MKKIKLSNKEVWIRLKDFNDYLISNYGRVKSEKFSNTRILKNSVNNCGYLSVCLSRNGKQKVFIVHRLVAYYFIGLCPKGKETNHIDGDKENPHVNNLEYITPSENQKHAYKNGLRSAVGAKNGRALIGENVVRKIRRLFETGKYTYCDLEAKFGVSYDNVSKIIKRKNWKHI